MVNKFSYIKERIKQIAKNKGISYEKLYKIIEMTDGGFKGSAIKRPINSDAIVKLYTKYPDINLHWLITGEKKYEQNDVVNMVEEPKYRNNYKKKYFKCAENYMKMNEENKKLKKNMSNFKKSSI